MRWRHQTFKPVRRAALKYWQKESGRSRHCRRDDDFSGALECHWQGRSPGRHVALFCGIGEWAGHITDLLSDKSNDHLRFDCEEDARRLARHYARLMFPVAELLSDFEDALKRADCSGVREKLGSRVDVFQIFVNKVIKHKVGALHRHDHHLPLFFEDGTGWKCENAIKLGVRDLPGKNAFDCILIPSLKDIVNIALDAYRNFDDTIKDEGIFNALVDAYGE